MHIMYFSNFEYLALLQHKSALPKLRLACSLCVYTIFVTINIGIAVNRLQGIHTQLGNKLRVSSYKPVSSHDLIFLLTKLSIVVLLQSAKNSLDRLE